MSKKQNKSIEDTYKIMNEHDHVLKLPDTHIGGTDMETKEMWISDNGKIVKGVISFVPGLFKIFDEILVNARDHSERDKTCKIIKVNIDKNTGMISVFNDGDSGIPVYVHKEYNVYVPQFIFSTMRSSSNYDFEEEKTWGGKNGYGAKLANIFSTEFHVHIVDKDRKLDFTQKSENNMYKINDPIIKTIPKPKISSTEIKFIPDYKRFGMENMTDDTYNLFVKRVYDVAACTSKDVKVYLNDNVININNFNDYIKMFTDNEIIYSEVNNRWKIGAVFDPNAGFTQVSYVNGISTYKGGTHVSYVFDQICKKLIEMIKTKNKNITVKASHIRENISLFIDCVVVNPKFDSQTKEFLTTKPDSYGSECIVTDKFVTDLAKTGLLDEVVRFAQYKEDASLKKTDGKKTTNLRNIKGYEHASSAGTRNSSLCRLILTEGESAKSFAMSGLEVVGREKYGIYPLRGKFLNVREASISQIRDNVEFDNMKKILGLKQGKKYTDTKSLNYGGIIILTDSDVDGSHIKGLIINMIHTFWPSLLKIKGFIQSMATPIMKAWKNKNSKTEVPQVFYTLTEYKNWLESDIKNKKYEVKYYKGLGTSVSKEAKENFTDIEKKIINYVWENNDAKPENNKPIQEEKEITDDDTESVAESQGEEEEVDINDLTSESHKSITLAFEKKRANDRKYWLQHVYDKNKIIDMQYGDVGYSEFINRDLIHFSNYDNIRSLPSVCDGLKPSQRKVLYASITKGGMDKKEIKVAQLAGYVSENTGYHHGEVSLQDTIVNMAQNFVGSNNINFLTPNGDFGTRRNGGKAASARYIYTQLSSLTRLLFRPEDDNILEYNYDDGKQIEPVYFVPIIPMVLINGTLGIGTGFSTYVPRYDPLDVAQAVLNRIDKKKPNKMKPWYNGHTGEIKEFVDKKKNEVKYSTFGTYEITGENTLRITELPVEVWTENYYADLEKLINSDKKKESSPKMFLENAINNSGNNTVDIKLLFQGKTLQTMVKEDSLIKNLKLEGKISISNMHLHNKNDVITKYENVDKIVDEFYDVRYQAYIKRKEYMAKHLFNQMNILQFKVKFINDVLKGAIVLNNRKKSQVHADLEKLKYPKMCNDAFAEDDKKTYAYTEMGLYTLTEERLKELNDEFAKIQKEYNEYMSTTVEDIWKKEINQFLSEYKTWLADYKNEILAGDKVVANQKQKGKPRKFAKD